MIHELTDEQWEQVYAHRQQWLDKGMSTQRSDRAAVEEAMAYVYKANGLEPPRMVWTDSPAQTLTAAFVYRRLPMALEAAREVRHAHFSLSMQPVRHDGISAALQGVEAQLVEQVGTPVADELDDSAADTSRLENLWTGLSFALADQFMAFGGEAEDRYRDSMSGQEAQADHVAFHVDAQATAEAFGEPLGERLGDRSDVNSTYALFSAFWRLYGSEFGQPLWSQLCDLILEPLNAALKEEFGEAVYARLADALPGGLGAEVRDVVGFQGSWNLARFQESWNLAKDSFGNQLAEGIAYAVRIRLLGAVLDRLMHPLGLEIADHVRDQMQEVEPADIGDMLAGEFLDNLGLSFDAGLGEQLHEDVGVSVWTRLTARIADALYDHLCVSLAGPLTSQLGEAVRDGVGKPGLVRMLGEEVRRQLGDSVTRDRLYALVLGVYDHLGIGLGSALSGQASDEAEGRLGDALKGKIDNTSGVSFLDVEQISARLWNRLYIKTAAAVDRGGDSVGVAVDGRLEDVTGDEAGKRLQFAMRGKLRDFIVESGAQLAESIMDRLISEVFHGLQEPFGAQTGIMTEGQLGDITGDELRAEFGDQLVDLRRQTGRTTWQQISHAVWKRLKRDFWAELHARLAAMAFETTLTGDEVGESLRLARSRLYWAIQGEMAWQAAISGVRAVIEEARHVSGRIERAVSEMFDAEFEKHGRQEFSDTRRNMIISAWDQYWLAYYAIPRDMGLVTYDEDKSKLLDAFAAVSFGCSSWTPYTKVCFLSERPTKIAMVGEFEQARLHCPDAPAIEFADGWAVHAWRGTRVPASLVTGDGWSVEQILAEPNAEIRRCAIERMGWDRFVEAAGLSAVDSCPDPGNPGFSLDLYDLPERLNPFAEPVRILLCTNGSPERDGTRRRFGLTVPVDVESALEAAAWGYDADDHPVSVGVEKYADLARRC